MQPLFFEDSGYYFSGENMYQLKTEQTFDAAHFLYGYDGKCRNLHGHEWRVIIEVRNETLEAAGQTRDMVVDFSTLKADLQAETDAFDHGLVLETGALKDATLAALREEGFKIVEMDCRPTAERLARYFYDRMTERGYQVVRSTVYETPKNCATYLP